MMMTHLVYISFFFISFGLWLVNRSLENIENINTHARKHIYIYVLKGRKRSEYFEQ